MAGEGAVRGGGARKETAEKLPLGEVLDERKKAGKGSYRVGGVVEVAQLIVRVKDKPAMGKQVGGTVGERKLSLKWSKGRTQLRDSIEQNSGEGSLTGERGNDRVSG